METLPCPGECSDLLSYMLLWLVFFTGRVVSPMRTPLFSGQGGPALVVSYDMLGRAVGLFYAQPTEQNHSKYARLKVILEENVPFNYTYYTVAYKCRIAPSRKEGLMCVTPGRRESRRGTRGRLLLGHCGECYAHRAILLEEEHIPKESHEVLGRKQSVLTWASYKQLQLLLATTKRL